MKRKKSLTAEELLNLPETKEKLESYSDEYGIKRKIRLDLAKTKKYKPNIFYHATGGIGESGVGRGLYLGKDRKALDNFYNSDGDDGAIIEYRGNPKFIDLSLDKDFDGFEKEAIKKYGKLKYNDHLRRLTLKKGFDGIRYYDPFTTGEEFVLYNADKVKAKNKKSPSNPVNELLLGNSFKPHNLKVSIL
jgi:hypothetical protein